ncbi:ADYC domain-containing protein [Pyxidicoccus sp. MSG2]|uniref:ADYC domain-containing protein n=1 Tax=Pyxidicoccus sp. MSG2 TaxID=2996790 RepID=UPI00226EAA36|nr:ADYC domain-containing protein [Pyxidicoccus sp. MSG2]MCY1015046.1 ADYC domain-containing protein [Pyxidicoccus sp. MSG2]
MKKSLLVCLFLQLPAAAWATAPAAPKPAASRPSGVVSDAERYARRCQSQSAHRIGRPQGTMLWGTRRDWNTEKLAPERSSVLVSADLAPLRQAVDGVKALRLEGGHLVAACGPDAGVATGGVVGTVLQGTSSDGKPVEVAICGAEPSPEDPGMVFYRIEAWNAVAQEWENPCVALDRVPDPRALAVSGVWDGSGAHQEAPGKLTFACENGAITKCITWGYKPWARRDGKPLADLHQACTRMARADYCGNGQNHTHQNTVIDLYDRFGLVERGEWDPAKASFEAAWAPDGATCLARTRDGRAMETILQECPNRFQTGAAVELGAGERCTVRRADVSPEAALLRNLTYAAPNR